VIPGYRGEHIVAARSTQQPEEPQPAEEESQVTTSADLGFRSREIEVDPIEEAPPTPDDQGMVVIRMAETIEEFTYGNPHMHYKLEAGHRYRVPAHIGRYLDSLGKVYH
jgi:hypothetical protein